MVQLMWKTIWPILKKLNRTFLVVQWLRLCASNTGPRVPSLVRKVPHGVLYSQKKRKKLNI